MTAKASYRQNSLDVSILNFAKHIGNLLDMSSRRPLGVPAPLPLFRFDVGGGGGGGRPISVAICPARQDGQQ